MAEPLTFLFKFQDDGGGGSSSSPPVGARSGGAAAAMQTAPSAQQQSQRGRASSVLAGAPCPAAPRGRSPGGGKASKGADDATPAGASPALPRRRPGMASDVFDDLLKAVRRLPGPIGKTVGLMNDLAEPFVRARRRYRELLETHRSQGAGQTERPTRGGAAGAMPAPSRQRRRRGQAAAAMPPSGSSRSSPGQTPASGGPPTRPRGSAANASPARAPRRRRPIEQPPGPAAQRGLIAPPKSPIPSSLAPERQALQKLIDALGPLPASERELVAALRPLRDLGYKSAELKQGLQDRRERLQRDAEHAASQQPNVARAQRQHARRQAAQQIPQRAPHRPGAAAQAARSTATATASQGGGSAAAAVGGALVTRGAAAGAMEGISALGGPVGLAIGLAVVATVGAATKAFDELVNTVQKLDHMMLGLSQKLAPFNGRLAAANAVNSAKNTIADIQRAQALGGKLATYVTERGNLQRELQRLNTKLESFELDVLNSGLKGLNDAMLGLKITGDTITNFFTNLSFLKSLTWGGILRQLQTALAKAALDAFLEAQRQKQLADQFAHPLDQFQLNDLIIDRENFGNFQKPVTPPGMRLGPIPPAGVGGI